jgi:hypothetical protein
MRTSERTFARVDTNVSLIMLFLVVLATTGVAGVDGAAAHDVASFCTRKVASHSEKRADEKRTTLSPRGKLVCHFWDIIRRDRTFAICK